MKFNQFNLHESLPMMQGMAIEKLANTIQGQLVEAGEIAPGEMPDLEGTLIYVKHKNSVSHCFSVWHDDGLGLTCRFLQIDGEEWQERVGSGDWQPTDFTLEKAA